MKCEIQVRTILQHAWAEIEHDIVYKSPGEIHCASISLPKRLKKGKKSAVIEEWNSETNGLLVVVSCIGQPPCTAAFPKLTELQIKEKRHANSKSRRRDRRG